MADSSNPMQESTGERSADARPRRRRSHDEIEAEKLLKLKFKRKRGRPSREDREERQKALIQAGLADPGSLGVVSNHGLDPRSLGGADGEKKKRRGRKRIGLPGSVPAHLVGRGIQGQIDGSFDAGYYLTVKVVDSDMVFRGVVFSQNRAVPVTRYNDIALGVKSVQPALTIRSQETLHPAGREPTVDILSNQILSAALGSALPLAMSLTPAQ